MAEAIPSNFALTPELPHPGGGRKNLQPFVRLFWDDTSYYKLFSAELKKIIFGTFVLSSPPSDNRLYKRKRPEFRARKRYPQNLFNRSGPGCGISGLIQ